MKYVFLNAVPAVSRSVTDIQFMLDVCESVCGLVRMCSIFYLFGLKTLPYMYNIIFATIECSRITAVFNILIEKIAPAILREKGQMLRTV